MINIRNFVIFTFWSFFNGFPLFSGSDILGSQKKRVQKVVRELSPTPRNIFCLDFFLRKLKQKLNWAKLLIFWKTFLFFDFFDHSDTHVILKNDVCRQITDFSNRKNSFQKNNSFAQFSFPSSLRRKKSKQKSYFGVGESSCTTFWTSETVN